MHICYTAQRSCLRMLQLIPNKGKYVNKCGQTGQPSTFSIKKTPKGLLGFWLTPGKVAQPRVTADWRKPPIVHVGLFNSYCTVRCFPSILCFARNICFFWILYCNRELQKYLGYFRF